MDHPGTRKVFGIGFHKTGTTSLAHALTRLGYRVTGPNGVTDPDIATHAYDLMRDLVPRYDAFQDNPWPLLYRELDEQHPGSLFILTTRDEDAWIASLLRHSVGKSTPMREWIYGVGSPHGHEDLYRERYRTHNADVRAHFAERPAQLLELPIPTDDAWERLGAFLGVEVPDEPFPHANSASEREGARPRRRLRLFR